MNFTDSKEYCHNGHYLEHYEVIVGRVGKQEQVRDDTWQEVFVILPEKVSHSHTFIFKRSQALVHRKARIEYLQPTLQ